MKEYQLSSYLSANNAAYIEELYETYLKNPDALDQGWRHYFKSLIPAGVSAEVSHFDLREQFRALAKQPKYAVSTKAASQRDEQQEAVDELIGAYRRFGHLNAAIDPLGSNISVDERLELGFYGLSATDMNRSFQTRQLLAQPTATLQEIYTALRQYYSGTVGVEYSRIANEKEREWLRDYVEKNMPNTQLSKAVKLSILKQLIATQGLEKFLDVKYPGQTRYSIEGADSIIPLLDELTKRARLVNVEELVIGMAHRGRLNVLLNVMGQSAVELFQEFEGTKDYGMTSGDVKYHRGFSSDVQTDNGPMHLSLAFNPSHLEFISPVVNGSVRARQERRNDNNKYNYALAVLIHGDAAFSGQGIVMETLNMSQTRAYHTGGSIHIILNNQVGFTTSNPHDMRSSHYCSDLARMIDAPVFHVNGDDPEAVVKVTQLALDYRMAFNKDVVIDLVCYRRFGHQEVDEPRATQPIMYQIIKKHKTPRTIYAEKLLAEGVCTQQEVDQWINEYRDGLDQGLQAIETLPEGLSTHYAANWTPYLNRDWHAVVDTKVDQDNIIRLAKQLEQLPEGFLLQHHVGMIMAARQKMTAGEQLLDWGYAEIMAYATLLDEGFSVRFSGEDSRRGTFFHRHSALFDQNTGECYMPLLHLSDQQANLQIYDSLLSESGALAFEYGYSTADPHALVIWEAQFGDFANGAQVMIDQFISSGWQKWNRLSGLVMLLPHGYEGKGPEHSSARLERYLQLCAQDNIQVFVPTSPSQIFHLLRRQVLRPYRKPLIVMTPKSLLRHKMATSSLDDLAKGQLQLIIPEVDAIDPQHVRRVILCSGKVFYEVLANRREENIDDIAIIRIEQLYPFPYDELKAALATYPNASELIWCQEEPKNQGAWFCTRDRLNKCRPEHMELKYAGRHSMAAPASGYPALHNKQQARLIRLALDIALPDDEQ